MKALIQKSGKISRGKIGKYCSLLFLFFVLSFQTSIAETGEPNVKNAKDNLSAIKEAQKKDAQAKIMDYVYMTLGFGLVIFVAWFSTAKAKQYKEKQDEKKRKFLESKLANHVKGHSGHRHGHKHKR